VQLAAEQVPAIDARYTRHRHGGQPFGFDAPISLGAWERRAAYLREHLRAVLGLDDRVTDCPLDAHLTVCGHGEGYVVERVWFQSRPGFLCTGNLYRPPDPVGAIPAILNPHGHWERGRLEDGPRGSIRARCIAFARMGMAAFAYDMVGYNDSLQVGSHRYASLRAALWGLSSMALQTELALRRSDAHRMHRRFRRWYPDLHVGCARSACGRPGAGEHDLGPLPGRLHL